MAQEVAQLVLQPGALRVAGAQPGAAAVGAGRRDIGAKALDLDLRIARQPLLQPLRQPQKGGGVDLLLIGGRHPAELAADRSPEERRGLAEQQSAERVAGLGRTDARPPTRRAASRGSAAGALSLPPAAAGPRRCEVQHEGGAGSEGGAGEKGRRGTEELPDEAEPEAGEEGPDAGGEVERAERAAGARAARRCPPRLPRRRTGELDHQRPFGAFGETVEGGIEREQAEERRRLGRSRRSRRRRRRRGSSRAGSRVAGRCGRRACRPGAEASHFDDMEGRPEEGEADRADADLGGPQQEEGVARIAQREAEEGRERPRSGRGSGSAGRGSRRRRPPAAGGARRPVSRGRPKATVRKPARAGSVATQEDRPEAVGSEQQQRSPRGADRRRRPGGRDRGGRRRRRRARPGATASAIRASRGAVRRPLASRSQSRSATTCEAVAASASSGRASAEAP